MTQSKAWKSIPVEKRVPIIQDFEATMKGLKRLRPDLSEVEIYQKYMKGNFMEDAINKFSRGESSSVFEDILQTEKAPEPPIETAAKGEMPQEVPEFMARGERPLPATVKPVEPTELKKVPEQPGPMIGPQGEFVEGTGEIQRPYPGQARLPSPIPLLQQPAPAPQPRTKPIPMPVGGTEAYFPEGAPIPVPPQPQLPMPRPLPISAKAPVTPQEAPEQPRIEEHPPMKGEVPIPETVEPEPVPEQPISKPSPLPIKPEAQKPEAGQVAPPVEEKPKAPVEERKGQPQVSEKKKRFPKSYFDGLYKDNTIPRLAKNRRGDFEEKLGQSLTDSQVGDLMVEMMQLQIESGEPALIVDSSPIQPDWLIEKAWNNVKP
jgi:hypothetical protein